MKPILVALAGPNGAGKTTFYDNYLRSTGLRLINADEIAKVTSIPAYEAATIADVIRRENLRLRQSFAMETVFSDPVGDKLKFLRDAIAADYELSLIYIGLASPALAQARVASRVADGGHDVPDEKIAARYERSLKNLAQAVTFTPKVVVLDNSLADRPYQFLAEFKSGRLARRAANWPTWAAGLEKG